MVSDNQNQDHHSYTEKMQRYVEALEVERRKIQVFQRELPLCLELVTQAIEGCKQQLSGTTTEYFHGQSECSEQTSSECPVLEQQFIPIKRTSSSHEDGEEEDGDEEQHSEHIEEDAKDSNTQNNNEKPVKKSDWLRSVQLWNQTPDLPTKLDSPRRIPVTEVKKSGAGAFQPFKKDKSTDPTPVTKGELSPSPVAPTAAASSTAESGGCSGGDCKKEEKEGQSQRKSRRCWSPELHRRFLDALQQLGGSHVATPKQIRELMKVDGLTNDEVKSHLQKYRLHTRRPNHSAHSNNNNNTQQAPQFVVVGGIWVPPQEYTATVATTAASTGAAATTNTIYAPIAAHPPQPPLLRIAPAQAKQQQDKQSKQLHSEERASRCEGGVHSHSPATSTSTASPAF